MNNPDQSSEIINLKAQLQRTDGAQLPVVQSLQNLYKVVAQTGKEVRGWGDDD